MCRILSSVSSQKDALENTAKTAADGQLALTFYPCVRGSNSAYHWVVVVYIHHTTGKTARYIKLTGICTLAVSALQGRGTRTGKVKVKTKMKLHAIDKIMNTTVT